jgi:hypothetical protein
MSDRTGMNIGEGIAPPPADQIGFRNQLRARWRGQPLAVRAGISIALFVIVAAALWSLDHSLSYAVLTFGALYWTHRLPPLPYKLAAQVVLVLIFLWQVRSFGILLAIIFAVFWVPNPYRARVTPAVAIVLAVLYPSTSRRCS